MKNVRVVSAAVSLLSLSVGASAFAQDDESEWSTESGQFAGSADEMPRHGPHRETTGADLTVARRRGTSVTLGQVQPESAPEVYEVRDGDTLWDITQRFLGNPWLWPRVWSYNPQIQNPHWIFPANLLRLVGGAAADAVTATPVSATTSAAEPRPRFGMTLEPGAVLKADEGYLDPDVLRSSGELVAAFESQMLLSDHDQAYVQFSTDEPVEAGQHLVIFREIDEDEREEEEQGVLVKIFGELEIKSYDRERRRARAVITDASDPIERGMRVASFSREIVMVAPRVASREVRARVIGSMTPHLLLGTYQAVFIDAGTEEGLEKGNQVFVLRSGDPWFAGLDTSPEAMGATLPIEEVENLPDEPVAQGRVVDVRAHTATVLMQTAVEPVELGDRLLTVQGR